MRSFVAIGLAAALLAAPAAAQAPLPAAQSSDYPHYSYADLADLASAAPIVADVRVHDSIRLKAAEGVPAGKVRFFVVADLLTLIRGRQGLPGQVRFLADFPLDGANRAPKLKNARFLLLAAPVAGKPDELRLIGPDALINWTPESDSRLRAMLTALTAPDAPPRVTGVGHAFFVPGSLPGESETQIFLSTADNRPVSLSILRRPGEAPRWAVALGEMVDEAAKPPAPDTLLWYRLACFLPHDLPDSATQDLAPSDAQAARADYAVVIEGLGPCVRHAGAAGD